MRPQSLAVIGLGAIGGSLAWQARLAGIAAVIGYSPEQGEGVQALKAGALTDFADTPLRAIRGAAFIVLATPPAATLDLLERLATKLHPGTVVCDVASIKAPIVERARKVGLGGCFAGAHPFAGTHQSGWSAARPDRFRDAVVYVTSTGGLEGDRIAGQVMRFWEEVMGAHPVLIDAEVHDRQLAWTSHLPQAVAYGLSRALARRNLGAVSFGTGVRDTTRLAGSNPDLWLEVFQLNQQPLVEALNAAEGELARLRELVRAGDVAGLRSFLNEAQEFRRTLDR